MKHHDQIPLPIPVQEDSKATDPRIIKLRKACEDGNLISCRQLLSLPGIDCNDCSEGDCSPLLVAMHSSNRNHELVSFLIDRGADINCQASSKAGRHGYQPIHYAVSTNSHDILRKLLGKEPRMSDFGLEPVHIAAFQGKVTALAILLDYETSQAGGSFQRMLNAQVTFSEAYPKKCLSQDVYAVGSLSTSTALHLAAYGGQDKAVSMLIKYGADVNAINARGWTPWHLAIYESRVQTVKLLLDARADIASRTRRGTSPFIIAASVGQIEIMEELINRSSDTMAIDSMGRGAVHRAAMFLRSENALEILSRLHNLGVPFDLCDIEDGILCKLVFLRKGYQILTQRRFNF